MTTTFQPIAVNHVTLLPSVFQERYRLNRAYMMSLTNDNLLQSFYMEAGLWAPRVKPEGIHWGWESPTCQVRGHFLGHWLSAAAHIFVETGDYEMKARADKIVSELARCQQENGGEWAGSIPSAYLDWIARGKFAWAPHYVLHKTLMGLSDMYALTGNTQALDIMEKWSRWFTRWTAQFTREQMDDILDWETGGMLEAWANLYGFTKAQEHLDLIDRYDRPRLFDRLLRGEDALTNMHANTTIPEIQGAARAWEVTGDQRWCNIVEAYWRMGVSERSAYCTGGQTCGEIWTPPGELAARLGDKNQEHCTVYNMMRVAQYLLTWTGGVEYADYWERNLYNGILAQQHPQTGMISYFLPLHAGAVKVWGTPTDDFWCCHGSLVQAQTQYTRGCYYQDAQGLVVTQYIPSRAYWEWQGVKVAVEQTTEAQANAVRRPNSWMLTLKVTCSESVPFTLKLRLPWWITTAPVVTVNGEAVPTEHTPSSYLSILRTWRHDTVRITLPKGIWTDPLPDEPNTVAFMDGPVVLAGLTDEERVIHGDPAHPEALLTPDNEREWGNWMASYRITGQERGLRFIPLHDVRDERYTVYFPIKPN